VVIVGLFDVMTGCPILDRDSRQTGGAVIHSRRRDGNLLWAGPGGVVAVCSDSAAIQHVQHGSVYAFPGSHVQHGVTPVAAGVERLSLVYFFNVPVVEDWIQIMAEWRGL
jgi:hypothetical protein